MDVQLEQSKYVSRESGLFPVGFPAQSRQNSQLPFLVQKSEGVKGFLHMTVKTVEINPSSILAVASVESRNILLIFSTPPMKPPSPTAHFFSAYHL